MNGLLIIRIMYPFLFLVLGFGFAFLVDWRRGLSKVLLYLAIPVASFYAISFYKGNLWEIIGLSIGAAGIMSAIGFFLPLSRYGTRRLMMCFFGYFNIGWLGIPVAAALYGHKGAMIMTAAYMGGTLYGNTVVAGIISQNSLKESILKVLKLPATAAFILGFLNRHYHFLAELHFEGLYIITKWVLTILGMGLIGMSLRYASHNRHLYKKAFEVSVFRFISGVIILATLLIISYKFQLIGRDEIKVLSLMGLLPVAANLVILEQAFMAKSGNGKSTLLVATSTGLSLGLLLAYGLVTSFL